MSVLGHSTHSGSSTIAHSTHCKKWPQQYHSTPDRHALQQHSTLWVWQGPRNSNGSAQQHCRVLHYSATSGASLQRYGSTKLQHCSTAVRAASGSTGHCTHTVYHHPCHSSLPSMMLTLLIKNCVLCMQLHSLSVSIWHSLTD